MRVAGLEAGTYRVTVFEGRTTDGNGRYGKVWVDDIKGLKVPVAGAKSPLVIPKANLTKGTFYRAAN